jgi:MbtH protein
MMSDMTAMINSAPDLDLERSVAVGWNEQEDNTIYKVVINAEEQYSIWPADREDPLGWKDAGKSGSKQECLRYIQDVWTDMRPLSLRKKMEEMEQQRT